MKLNARQKAFCEYYVACGNATEAAKKKGTFRIKNQAVGLAKPSLCFNICKKNIEFRSERGVV